ncbi:MAG: DNA alkylation repair protein [bacterium]
MKPSGTPQNNPSGKQTPPSSMTAADVLKVLKEHANPNIVAAHAHYGVETKKAFGISAPILHRLAKQIGINQILSRELWKTEYLEARALAALIGDPVHVTQGQMQKWVSDFDNWAVCDACCLYLFRKTPFAYEKAIEWCLDNAEYIRRAGFVMIAVLAVHDKKTDDSVFINLFPLLLRGATDERNFVKKAVNWALRQIGKRNRNLNVKAIKLALTMKKIDSSAARWIASDALRELRSPAVQQRVRKPQSKESHPLSAR